MNYPTCPITLELLKDDSNIHQSPHGTSYDLLSLKKWMNMQNNSTGFIYYPTREIISVEKATSLGLLSEEYEDDTETEIYGNELGFLLIKWLKCYKSFQEDSRNFTEISDETYDVDYDRDSISRLRHLMNHPRMVNFDHIVEVLRRDELIYVSSNPSVIMNCIESIESGPFHNQLGLDWTFRESLNWIVVGGFPINNPFRDEIYYGGLPCERSGTISSRDVERVTKAATIEIIDLFINEMGVENACRFLDDDDIEKLSIESRRCVENHMRDIRHRRRVFRSGCN